MKGKIILWNYTLLKNGIYVKEPKKKGEYFKHMFLKYINSENKKVIFNISINDDFNQNKEIITSIDYNRIYF